MCNIHYFQFVIVYDMSRKLLIIFAFAGLVTITSCKSSKKCGCPTFGQVNAETEMIVCAPPAQDTSM